jgi:hypothetical protein
VPDQESKKEPIKVTDRRSFTPGGERRSPESEGPDDPGGPQAETVLGEGFRMSPAPDEPKSRDLPGSHFSLLILSLSSTAFMQLGEIPDPMTARTEVNLDAARHTIDMIEALREKTRGNLTAEEEQLISEILSELKLAYVHRASSK